MIKPVKFNLKMVLLAMLTASVMACGGGDSGGGAGPSGPQSCVLGSASLGSCTLN